MKKWSRTKTVGVLLLAVTLGALVVGNREKLSWRGRLVWLYLSEDVPGVRWSDVLAGLLPAGTATDTPDVRGLVAGDVQLARFEPESAPCPALWSTPLGPIWSRLRDERILEYLIDEQLGGIYHNDFVSVKEGDVVLDVGGHLGVFTWIALDAGAGKVIAFEPEPVNAECFRRTFGAEIETGQVVLIDAAAYEHEGTLEFEAAVDPNEWYGSVTAGVVEEKGNIQVRSVTIDQAIGDVESVDFIKMDIEGSERHALRGAVETLRRFKPEIAICVYHRDDDPQVIPAIILAAQPTYEHQAGPSQHYFR